MSDVPFKEQAKETRPVHKVCSRFPAGSLTRWYYAQDGIMYVVDDGFLLHKVHWHALTDMYDILPLFVSFSRKLGPVVCVVFDGYGDQPSTKDREHARCASQ